MPSVAKQLCYNQSFYKEQLSFWNDKENHFYQLFFWIYTSSRHKFRFWKALQKKCFQSDIIFRHYVKIPPIKFWERLTKFMISISLSEKFCCQNLITSIKRVFFFRFNYLSYIFLQYLLIYSNQKSLLNICLSIYRTRWQKRHIVVRTICSFVFLPLMPDYLSIYLFIYLSVEGVWNPLPEPVLKTHYQYFWGGRSSTNDNIF